MIEDRVRPLAVPRTETGVLLDQLRGIEAWTCRHRPSELDLDAATTREDRLDLARRRDVVERQRQALQDWTAQQLRMSGDVHRTAPLRAVIVHRSPWFRAKVALELQHGGVAVIAQLENGAEAVGVVVAEQPDVVLVEDKLPMINGLEVTKAVRAYAPRAVVVAQVTNEWETAPFLEAGAATAYPRRTPPADIAADLRAYFLSQP
ncbi:MAG: DNA-binding response regulator [Frankiales bacterium]|nr:DNA-binding response regulator [Frankiales bacterium]